MGKILMIHYEKCTGCRLCMLACSLKKEGDYNPSNSRMALLKGEAMGLNLPMVCYQCSRAPCMNICPKKALYRKMDAEIILWNPKLCIGCGLCVRACPFGAIVKHSGDGAVRKCDLCDGDPECVKYCAYGALEYVEETEEVMEKRRVSLAKLPTLFQTFVE